MAELPDTVFFDRTVSDIDFAMEAASKADRVRHYLGGSQIGKECPRELFYSFRAVDVREIPAIGLKAIQDGFVQELVMAYRLRMLPHITLYTQDPQKVKDISYPTIDDILYPKEDKNQISFSMVLGHFRGNLDGIISGLKESSKWHVWEHKSVNLDKFNKLIELRNKLGEKNALREWDGIYYAQAQIYMHSQHLERHFLTVTCPGGRGFISIRTDYDRVFAESLVEKAHGIICDNFMIPAKYSQKPTSYTCKLCDYTDVCHAGKIPLVHCKTCRYCKVENEGKWNCALHEKEIPQEELLLDTCPDHVYNPALMPDTLEFVEHQDDCGIYKKEKIVFANCKRSGFPELKGDIHAVFTSQELYKLGNIANITAQNNVIPSVNEGTSTKFATL